MQVGSRLVNAHLDRERINITRQPKDEPAQVIQLTLILTCC